MPGAVATERMDGPLAWEAENPGIGDDDGWDWNGLDAAVLSIHL